MNSNVFDENEKEAYFYARALYKLLNQLQDDKKFNDIEEKEQMKLKIVSSAFARLVCDKVEYNNLKKKMEEIEKQL
jgi:hypothetical protein